MLANQPYCKTDDRQASTPDVQLAGRLDSLIIQRWNSGAERHRSRGAELIIQFVYRQAGRRMRLANSASAVRRGKEDSSKCREA
ncbi:hypothetical protein J2W79_005286 [Methylorubrum extorquens]|nr:hypothetical protein [Methylorubrum extorquens]